MIFADILCVDSGGVARIIGGTCAITRYPATLGRSLPVKFSLREGCLRALRSDRSINRLLLFLFIENRRKLFPVRHHGVAPLRQIPLRNVEVNSGEWREG